MKKIKVAINGLGRIGRSFLKASILNEQIQIVAVNDLASIENIAYLLKYDTVYGKSNLDIKVSKDILVVNGKNINFLSEKDPEKLPWKAMQIDVVIEATGKFTKFETAETHITAGAKRVVLTAPAKDDPKGPEHATILVGINDEKLKDCRISSNASCTTNAGSPVLKILQEKIGIEKAILNTIHSYTSSQSMVDGPNQKNPRLGRAGALNMIPTSTGAAIATTKAITELSGKFDGVAIRVPTPAGSIADITFIASKNTTIEEVNKVLKDAARDKKWEGIFNVTEEPLVSSDIIGARYGAIADLGMTRVVDGNLVKVLSWYDNEVGYVYTLLAHVLKIVDCL